MTRLCVAQHTIRLQEVRRAVRLMRPQQALSPSALRPSTTPADPGETLAFY